MINKFNLINKQKKIRISSRKNNNSIFLWRNELQWYDTCLNWNTKINRKKEFYSFFFLLLPFWIPDDDCRSSACDIRHLTRALASCNACTKVCYANFTSVMYILCTRWRRTLMNRHHWCKRKCIRKFEGQDSCTMLLLYLSTLLSPSYFFNHAIQILTQKVTSASYCLCLYNYDISLKEKNNIISVIFMCNRCT